MSRIRISLVAILAVVLSASASVGAAQSKRAYYAAVCMARSSKCLYRTARRTNWQCGGFRSARTQPPGCRTLACSWCTSHRNQYPCNVSPLRNICRHRSTPYYPPRPRNPPKPSPYSPPRRPTRPRHPRSGCTWYGSDSVVIDLSQVTPAEGWSKVSRSGFNGLIYEKNKVHGIDRPGARGKMCFNVHTKASGNYFFAALSYAPHNTEHNDMWVNSPDLGFQLWQRRKLWRYAGPEEWLKAYQNNGNKGMSVSLKTKDFDGHRFIVPNVQAGKTFRVCISGRSYKYEVYRLYLIKCTGLYCTGLPMMDLGRYSPSTCT